MVNIIERIVFCNYGNGKVGLGEKHYGIVNLCTFMIRHGTGAVCFVEHLKYLGFFQVNKITAVFNL